MINLRTDKIVPAVIIDGSLSPNVGKTLNHAEMQSEIAFRVGTGRKTNEFRVGSPKNPIDISARKPMTGYLQRRKN